MGAAFEGSADQYVALAKQLENQDVVGSTQEALDFLTTAFQELPSEMQAPLVEAVDEYGTFLEGIGFSTEETFDILTQAAEGGERVLDKTGDALKEFSIRATDMSTASRKPESLRTDPRTHRESPKLLTVMTLLPCHK